MREDFLQGETTVSPCYPILASLNKIILLIPYFRMYVCICIRKVLNISNLSREMCHGNARHNTCLVLATSFVQHPMLIQAQGLQWLAMLVYILNVIFIKALKHFHAKGHFGPTKESNKKYGTLQ